MAPVAIKTCAVSAKLHFERQRLVGGMHTIARLVAGLLYEAGHQSLAELRVDDHERQIRTADYAVRLRRAPGRLHIHLAHSVAAHAAQPGADRRRAQLLADLTRSLCAVLHPARVAWDGDPASDTMAWLAGFAPVRPRTTRPKTRSRSRGQAVSTMLDIQEVAEPRGVACWPNRPGDAQDTRARPVAPPPRLDRTLRKDVPHPEARPREPVARQVCAWTLTATTTALAPPAGAAVAVVNVARGAQLRLNIHALLLTITVLALYQSGVFDAVFRSLLG